MTVENRDILQILQYSVGGGLSLKCYSKSLLHLSLCYERGSTDMNYLHNTEWYVSIPNI